MNNKSLYIKALRKFWRKKLKHIKKPMRRKRKIVDEHAFATAARCQKHGVGTLKNIMSESVMNELNISLEKELKNQGHLTGFTTMFRFGAEIRERPVFSMTKIMMP